MADDFTTGFCSCCGRFLADCEYAHRRAALSPELLAAASQMLHDLSFMLSTGLCARCQSSTLRQVGRSVYCGECGARLYQGRVPTSDIAEVPDGE